MKYYIDVKRIKSHYYSLKLKDLQGIIKLQLHSFNNLCPGAVYLTSLCLCFLRDRNMALSWGLNEWIHIKGLKQCLMHIKYNMYAWLLLRIKIEKWHSKICIVSSHLCKKKNLHESYVTNIYNIFLKEDTRNCWQVIYLEVVNRG